MSTTMNEEASANSQGRAAPSETTRHTSTTIDGDEAIHPAASASYRETLALREEMNHPKLTGKYTFIKPLAETQRGRLATDMAKSCKAMLTIVEDIRLKSEKSSDLRSAIYATTQAAGDTPASITPFIPKNIREIPMPLNHSKTVKKDSRCNASFSAITTQLGRAKQLHESFKVDMARLAQDVAKLELDARKEILLCEYALTAENLAEGFFITGKYKLGHKPSLRRKEIAHAAIHHAVCSGFSDEHWQQLPFVMSSAPEDIEGYHKKFMKFTGIDFESTIAPKLKAGRTIMIEDDQDDLFEDADDKRDYGSHPDWPLIEWIADELSNALPILSTKLWAHEQKKDMEKKMDAELDLLYSSKEVDRANEDLGNAMEVDEGDAMRSHISKTVDKEVDRRITNRKKAARKNSSDEPTGQGSMSNENGQKRKKKSKKKKRKSKQQQKSDSSDSSDSDNNTRRSRSRHRSDDQTDTQRGRSNKRTPKSILRKDTRSRSVSFGRPTTPDPPRSRYSDEKSTHRNRGSARQHGTREGRGGRGGSQRGRGGKNGKRK